MVLASNLYMSDQNNETLFGERVILSRLFKGLRNVLFSFPLPISEAYIIDA